MYDILFMVLGGVLLLVGFVGCVVPVVPGPLFAFLGYLAALGIAPHDRPGSMEIAVAALMVAVVVVLDYVVPALGARKFRCSRLGVFGCMAGTVVGLFFMPLGVMLGPFIGALLGELVGGRTFGAALKGAFGAFLGYIAGLFLKVVCCGLLTFWFIQIVIR